jgi:hypothetical protein
MKHSRAHRITCAAITLCSCTALPASTQTIDENLKLLPTDGAAEDNFGTSIAISGTIAIIGAVGDDDLGSFSGSAYLFDTTTGQQIAKLLPDDGAEQDFFGESVAISGLTAVVGARGNDDNGNFSGSAYLFDVLSGLQTLKFLPDDGAERDFFGLSVATNGNIVAIGSREEDEPGSVYLFDLLGQQLNKLQPDDGRPGAHFGDSLAMSGDLVVIGAPSDIPIISRSGSAYVFNASTGEQVTKLIPKDGESFDEFGHSVAIYGDTVVVGAPRDKTDQGEHRGAAYMFNAISGQQITKLIPNDTDDSVLFGSSVAISGNAVLVGARLDDVNGLNSGSVYRFDMNTGLQIDKLLPTDGGAENNFGYSIAMSENTVAIGAVYDDDNDFRSGSSYIFTVAPCTADLTGDNTLNFFDVSAFLTAFGAREPIADFNNDGVFNFFDVSAFLEAYLAGCP